MLLGPSIVLRSLFEFTVRSAFQSVVRLLRYQVKKIRARRFLRERFPPVLLELDSPNAVITPYVRLVKLNAL